MPDTSPYTLLYLGFLCLLFCAGFVGWVVGLSYLLYALFGAAGPLAPYIVIAVLLTLVMIGVSFFRFRRG